VLVPVAAMCCFTRARSLARLVEGKYRMKFWQSNGKKTANVLRDASRVVKQFDSHQWIALTPST
jgi:hypothetical protein